MSVATSTVLQVLAGKFVITHLDTADRRPLSTVGRLDLTNLYLGLRHAFTFLFLLIRHRPDAVYMPIAQAPLGFLRDACFLLPSRLCGIPTIVHLHGGYFARFYSASSTTLKALIRFCLKRVSCAIVLGNGLRGVFDGVLPRDRIRVVPNGVNDFAGGFIERTPPFLQPRILFLSTLVESKGVLDALRAVPLVRGRLPTVQFIFVGEWADRSTEARARELIRSLEIEPNVMLLGAQEGLQKHETLLASHLFILPSYYPYEGQPLAILEAMCASLPVLTTAAGCIAETVVDGVSGLILPAGKPQLLGAAILQTLGSRHLYQDLASASRARFENHYSSHKFGQRLVEVLAGVCGRPSHVGREATPPHHESSV